MRIEAKESAGLRNAASYVAVGLLSCALMLGGCGPASPAGGSADSGSGVEAPAAQGNPASPDKARAASAYVSAALEGFASKDAKAVKKVLSCIGFDPADYGVSWKAFASTYYDGFCYTVDGTEQALDSADGVGVSFTVTVPRMGKTIELMRQVSVKCIEEGADPDQAGYADRAWKKAWSKLGGKVDRDELTATLFVRENKKGAWEMEDACSFAALLTDGYDPRQA